MLSDVKKHLQVVHGLPEELLGEFIDSFLESFDTSVEELKPFAEGTPPDWMEIRRITHAIRGYAELVGADDLLALSRSLNAAAHAQDAEGCRAGAQAIRDLRTRYAAES